MQLGAVLDVFISLAFMFFLLSLVASCGQEIVAGFLAWRGTYLSKGIDVIMDNRSNAKFQFDGIKDWLRAHLTKHAGKTVGDAYREEIDRKNIAARKADPAAVGITPNPVLERVLDVQKHPLLRSSPTTLPSYVPARNFSTALLGVLRDGSQSALFSQVETTVAALPAGDLRTTLTLFVQDAGGDIDALRARLEQWFDDAMDRVTGAYKRLTQYVMLAFGLVLAASLNVDTPHVIRVLSMTPPLRAAIVAQAAQAAAPSSTSASTTGAGTPGASTTGAGTTGAGTPASGEASFEQRSAALRNALSNFETQGFPVGWACWRDETPAPLTGKQACPNTAAFAFWSLGGMAELAGYGLAHLPGWIMTAIAISLGAPFWFGLLQNVVNLRNAGAKPNRSDDPRAPGAAV